MISGGCASIYGALFVLLGIAGLYVSALESERPLISGIVLSLGLFAWGGFILIRAVGWMKLLPASALVLFDDHFCIGSQQFPYSALLGVKLERFRMRKTLNFVPMGTDETIIAKVTVTHGVFRIRAGAGPLTTTVGSIGQAETERFVETVRQLEQRALHCST